MHYWIDGYNLLFRITKNYREMKENERKILLTLNKLLLKYQVTIVFDGREKDPPEALRKNLNALALIYTPYHQTADDYILDAISDASDPSNETVISSDQELLRKARQRGAHTITVEKFLSKLIQRKKKKSPAPPKEIQETDYHLQRLLKIFEDRLKEE